MESVSGTNTATTNQSIVGNSSSSDSLAKVNFDTFIKLLATQLQNQDPLNPMDGTAFTEQIATFASLEQQISTNTYLKNLNQAQNFGAQTLAVSYIGKEVLVPAESAEFKNSQMQFSYELDKAATATEIRIVDQFGTTVEILEGENKAGLHDVFWDGVGLDGETVPEGSYRIFVSAVNEDGTILTDTFAYSRVVSVEGNADNVKLQVATGQTQAFADVIRVREVQGN